MTAEELSTEATVIFDDGEPAPIRITVWDGTDNSGEVYLTDDEAKVLMALLLERFK